MPRQPRIDPPNGYHHVMNRGTNHDAVFFTDEDRVEFCRLLSEIHDRYGVVCLAYCLMDNHYHLILKCPNGHLSDAMQHLGGVYTQHTNERGRRDGPLFRGRFRSIPITTDAYLLCAVRYVHRNPLDLPGVSDPSEYRWSSHRAYLGHRRPASWLQTDEVLDHFLDVAHFNDFTSDWTALPPSATPTAADVRSIIRMAIEVHDGSDEPASAQWLDTAVLHLLDASGELDPFRAGIDGLPPTGSQASRSATFRARRRAREHPELIEMAEFAASLLASTRRVA
jgi:REP element-mobilizing transposase RayT